LDRVGGWDREPTKWFKGLIKFAGENSKEGVLYGSGDNLYYDMSLAGYGVRLGLIPP